MTACLPRVGNFFVGTIDCETENVRAIYTAVVVSCAVERSVNLTGYADRY